MEAKPRPSPPTKPAAATTANNNNNNGGVANNNGGAANNNGGAANNNGRAANNNGVAARGPPSTHAQIYGSIPSYHRLRTPPPNPPRRRRRHRRNCCCSSCLWLSLALAALLLLSAAVAGVLYAIYRPRSPAVSLSSLRLSDLNLTAAGLLSARLDVAVTARNPNEKLVFHYGPTTVSASAHGAVIGGGAFPAFEHATKNATALRATLSTSELSVGAAAAAELRGRSRLSIDLEMETSAATEIGGRTTEPVRVGVSCIGIRVPKPERNRTATASTGDIECKAKVYVKLWEWTV